MSSPPPDSAIAMLCALPEAAVLLNRGGEICAANTEASQLFGVLPEALAARNISSLFSNAPDIPLLTEAQPNGEVTGTLRLSPEVGVSLQLVAVQLNAAPYLLGLIRRQLAAVSPSTTEATEVDKTSSSQPSIDALPQPVLLFDERRRVADWNTLFAAMDPLQGKPMVKGMSIGEVHEAMSGPRFVEGDRVVGNVGQQMDAVFAGETRTFELRLGPRLFVAKAGPAVGGGALFTFTEFSDARHSGVLLRMLAQGTAIANQSRDTYDAVRRCISAVCAEGRWVIGHAYLRDTASEDTVLRSYGFGHADGAFDFQAYRDATVERVYRPGEHTIGRVFESNTPAWFEDLNDHVHLPRINEAINSGLGSAAVVPIRGNSGVVGVFEVSGLGPALRDEQMIDVLLELGGHIARVFEREQASNALKAARRAAEDAVTAKSQFLANMSHEIRTPLNVIQGFSELGLRASDPVRLRRYIEMIHRSSQDLVALVDDILDVSRIDAGRVELEQIVFRLDDLLDEVAHRIAIIAADKPLELLFDLSSELPVNLRGDPLRLRQVLTNLCSNAVKFTDDGYILVSVRVIGPVTSEARLQFVVEDSGVGIAQEHLDDVFDLFAQVDASVTRKHGGSGLGLAICKQLVELMGGDIVVESAPEHGSRFSFTVELTVVDSSAAPIALPMQARDRRVLVVDPALHSLALAREYVSRAGLAVVAVSGLDEALAHTQEVDPFGILLVDWDVLGGEAVSRLQRLKEAMPGARIVITATNPGETERALAAEAGVVRLVTKPLTPGSVYRLLAEQVDAIGPAQTEPVPAAALRRKYSGHVLVVEDNALNRRMARELLETLGLDVTTAANGKEAVELVTARAADFAVVFMDMQMPEMDGLSATRSLRSATVYDHVPIVAMTANVMRDDRERYERAGMQDVVAKPVDVDELCRVLDRWVSAD